MREAREEPLIEGGPFFGRGEHSLRAQAVHQERIIFVKRKRGGPLLREGGCSSERRMFVKRGGLFVKGGMPFIKRVDHLPREGTIH